MGPFKWPREGEEGAWIRFSVSGGLDDGKWVQTYSDSLGFLATDCKGNCPFIPTYSSGGNWFMDDPARPNGQDITWVGQISYLLPGAPGAAFTIEWGYSMSNRNLSYITPSVATPWPSQQRLISGAQLSLQP
jgi:hypothetical protein